MSNTVLIILKDLSHPTFFIVVIAQSSWALELVKIKFHFHGLINFKKRCIVELSQKLLPNYTQIVTA